jgi:hypothetical protein
MKNKLFHRIYAAMTIAIHGFTRKLVWQISPGGELTFGFLIGWLMRCAFSSA